MKIGTIASAFNLRFAASGPARPALRAACLRRFAGELHRRYSLGANPMMRDLVEETVEARTV
jgi:hypothetical protein